MNKSKIFFLLSLSIIAGIFSASFYYPHSVDNFYFFVILILSLIGWLVFYKNKRFSLGVFVVLFFLLGSWMTELRLERIIQLDVASHNFSGEVLVIKEPNIKDRMQKVVAQEKTGEKFLIVTMAYEKYEYGDRLQVDCVLEIPKNIENFDYQMYLAKDKIFYICKNPKIKFIFGSC